MSFLFKRALLRLRGYGFRRRDEGSVAREDLARIDVGWTGAAGIGMVDPILGAEFQARHVLMALRSGEPYRVLRAMSIELAYESLSPRTHRRAAKVLAVLRALLREADVPEWRMLAGGVETYYWYSQGEFSRACEVGDEAIELARDACTGVRWELVSAELYRLWSQYWMGDISPMSKRIHFLRREAASLGDRYAGITLRSGFPAIGALLANGSTQHLRLHVRHAMDMWPKEGFHLEHLWASAALAHAELYSGDGERAYAMVTEMWPALRRSMLMHVGMITIDCLHLRARCAIAASSGNPGNPCGAQAATPMPSPVLRSSRRARWAHCSWRRSPRPAAGTTPPLPCSPPQPPAPTASSTCSRPPPAIARVSSSVATKARPPSPKRPRPCANEACATRRAPSACWHQSAGRSAGTRSPWSQPSCQNPRVRPSASRMACEASRGRGRQSGAR